MSDAVVYMNKPGYNLVLESKIKTNPFYLDTYCCFWIRYTHSALYRPLPVSCISEYELPRSLSNIWCLLLIVMISLQKQLLLLLPNLEKLCLMKCLTKNCLLMKVLIANTVNNITSFRTGTIGKRHPGTVRTVFSESTNLMDKDNSSIQQGCSRWG